MKKISFTKKNYQKIKKSKILKFRTSKTKQKNIVNKKNRMRKYSYQLTSQDIKKLICPICLDMLKDPVLEKCGHSYCKKCLVELLKNDKKCPQSREEINEFFPNLILKNLILKLNLQCEDCKETIHIKDKKKHEIICNFRKQEFTKDKIIDEYMKLFCDKVELEGKGNRMERIKKISKNKDLIHEKDNSRNFFSFSNMNLNEISSNIDLNEFFGNNVKINQKQFNNVENENIAEENFNNNQNDDNDEISVNRNTNILTDI